MAQGLSAGAPASSPAYFAAVRRAGEDAGVPAERLTRQHRAFAIVAVWLMAGCGALADPLTDRIAESAVAAQALQGPLDGAWTLRGSGGAVLFTFQMSDPPGSVGPVEGAWRDPAGAIGAAEFVADGRRLRVTVEGAAPATLVLIARRARGWRGSLSGRGAVVLTPHLATP